MTATVIVLVIVIWINMRNPFSEQRERETITKLIQVRDTLLQTQKELKSQLETQKMHITVLQSIVQEAKRENQEFMEEIKKIKAELEVMEILCHNMKK